MLPFSNIQNMCNLKLYGSPLKLNELLFEREKCFHLDL